MAATGVIGAILLDRFVKAKHFGETFIELGYNSPSHSLTQGKIDQIAQENGNILKFSEWSKLPFVIKNETNHYWFSEERLKTFVRDNTTEWLILIAVGVFAILLLILFSYINALTT